MVTFIIEIDLPDYVDIGPSKLHDTCMKALHKAVPAFGKFIKQKSYWNDDRCPTCKGTGRVKPDATGYDGCPDCNYGDGPTGERPKA